MERKFLEDLGLEKEVVDKILDANSTDIGKAKRAGETATERVTELEGQLADVAEKLKDFDGVDVEGLNGQIATLTADMAAKEAEYAATLADRDFTALLSGCITEARGINPKAVAALLDTDTLKGSKNQKDDIATALAALRESDPNQFESDEKPIIITKPASGGGSALSPIEAVKQKAAQRYAEAKKE